MSRVAKTALRRGVAAGRVLASDAMEAVVSFPNAGHNVADSEQK
jgi:hypothetical protein